MKTVRIWTGMLALLLITLLLLTACNKEKTPSNADTTEAPVTEAPTETPTEAPTEAPTEGETEAPAELTAEEIKTLLSAALNDKMTETAAVTVKSYLGGGLLTEQIVQNQGNDFLSVTVAMGAESRVIAVGDTVYFYMNSGDGELKFVLTPTADQRAELYDSFVSDEGSADMEDEELVAGLLNSPFVGRKLSNGTVELTCTEPDSNLVALFADESAEDVTMTLAIVLDAEGRMTGMNVDMTLPAEQTGEEAAAVTVELLINYSPDPITAPADAADYVPSTYEDLFTFTYPDPEPEEAASANLPLDGDNYTVGGENPAVEPAMQYAVLAFYPQSYTDKTFTLYGNLAEDEYGNLILSIGEDMYFFLYFDGVSEPTVGSYIKVTAAFTQTVDMGDYKDFDCFTMMVTDCEVLGEAKGPNGGKLMYITASSLNVRTSSDTSSSDNILGQLSKGDLVEVFEQDAKGWYRIEFNGQKAYISNNYVSETKP